MFTLDVSLWMFALKEGAEKVSRETKKRTSAAKAALQTSQLQHG
jgi:hypothetical protein